MTTNRTIEEPDVVKFPIKVRTYSNSRDGTMWDRITADCRSLAPGVDGTNWARDQLEGLSPFVGSVILENNYICKDHRNLHSQYYSKKFTERSNRCHRIHLFAEDVFRDLVGNFPIEHIVKHQKRLQESYIGYLVIRPHGSRVIGRSVLNPDKLGKGVNDHFYSLSAPFKVHLLGGTLMTKGYPWISQDAEAMVCAHAALWGVCRYLSQRYQVYKELYPYDFITFTSTHSGRTVPYRGMTYSDYSEILAKFGCHPLVMEDVKLRGPEFETLYSYVESGFPVLASTGGHVIVLIGHTLDPTRRVRARKGIIDSSSFVDALLVVDDNALPYQKLKRARHDSVYGRMYASKRLKKPDLTIFGIKNCVIPLPEKVYLPAERARSAFHEFLRSIKSWNIDAGKRVRKLIRDKELVVRQFVTTGAAIKAEARARYEAQKSRTFAAIMDTPMPHFVWVMELASLAGYKNGKCFGEIVMDATANERDQDNGLFIRIDGMILRGFQDYGVSMVPVVDCPQFRNNLGNPNVSPTGR